VNDDEDDHCSSQNTDASSRDQSPSASPIASVSEDTTFEMDTCLRIQERIHIETLSRMCEVGKSKIKCEQDNDGKEIQPRMR
jgi:hypothetical protein